MAHFLTPYAADLDRRDPLEAIAHTTTSIEATTSNWTAERFEQSYAPGKWSGRLILTHLAQTEIALGNRVRMALATPGYQSQNFDQDAWMVREQSLSGTSARQAFLATAQMNLQFFSGLSVDDRAVPFSHPEYGALTVDWVIHQIAGHQIHHLKQLVDIGSRA